MTMVQLRASLKRWQGRVAYRRVRYRFYATRSKRPEPERQQLRDKWHASVVEAKEHVALRHRQIVSMNRHNHKQAAAASGVTRFDSVPVAAWIVPYLVWARENGWQGRLVSGWRDPAYSQKLCYRMCGRPSCPGLCAGLNSNHVGSERPRGAVDVTDYYRFGQLMQRCPYQPKLVNHLPNDRVHWSASGN